MTFGILQQCVGCPRADECAAEGKKRKAHTFATEYRFGVYWLTVMDEKGVELRIAEFHDREAVDIFNETLALAKAAAHAHGVNGI